MIETELTFIDNQGGLLVITSSIANQLMTYRQIDVCSTEAAGVLIGERRGIHLVIDKISEPGKGDIRQRYFVDRRGPHHQATVDDAFVSSSGRLQYIGEWHTHPEDEPSPSSKDLNTWQRCLVANDQMVLLIIGRRKIWAAKKIAGSIIPLHLEE
nr:Mov34/MPN/PAD-1 family protein [Plesiomonas shigelloides]